MSNVGVGAGRSSLSRPKVVLVAPAGGGGGGGGGGGVWNTSPTSPPSDPTTVVTGSAHALTIRAAELPVSSWNSVPASAATASIRSIAIQPLTLSPIIASTAASTAAVITPRDSAYGRVSTATESLSPRRSLIRTRQIEIENAYDQQFSITGLCGWLLFAAAIPIVITIAILSLPLNESIISMYNPRVSFGEFYRSHSVFVAVIIPLFPGLAYLHSFETRLWLLSTPSAIVESKSDGDSSEAVAAARKYSVYGSSAVWWLRFKARVCITGLMALLTLPIAAAGFFPLLFLLVRVMLCRVVSCGEVS